jgi:glycosyltransferase involved in cell wall biosynthesis
MCGISNCNSESSNDLAVLLWQKLDILSTFICTRGTLEERACSAARKCMEFESKDTVPGIPIINTTKDHEVKNIFTISQLSDYYELPEFNYILKIAKEIKDKKLSICFFNSTPRGGGVAIIRSGMMRFLNLLGIDCHWYVMRPNPRVFEITKKKIHNVLQGINHEPLTDSDKTLFQEWSISNFKEWQDNKNILNANVIVIDDPQPIGLIPFLKKSKATIIYRSHTELRSDLINNSNTVQSDTWNYLWNNIKLADIFISHPIDSFIPKTVLNSNLQIVKLPASTDPIDGLNKKLDPDSIQYYKILFNKISKEQTNKTVDFNRMYFIQICRFDPSKGIPDLIEAYTKFRQNIDAKFRQNIDAKFRQNIDAKFRQNIDAKFRQQQNNEIKFNNVPQLIITGHGSIDDPESIVIYNQVISIISKIEPEIAKDIIPVLLHSNDQLLNCILDCSTLAFQLSIREGYEIKVTEALMKGKPIIAYNTGGIPLQIIDKFNGFLIERGNTSAVAELMYKFISEPEFYKIISDNTKKVNYSSVSTPICSLKYMEIVINN